MPTDYFALLGQARLPWIDLEKLKASFLAFSAEVHPDRFHAESPERKEEATRRFAELNGAYNCLRTTRDRLLHLIELETGAKPREIQTAPTSAMNLFMEVGKLTRDVDAFLAARSKISSPILQVEQFERAHEWMEKLKGLQQKLDVMRDEWTSELQSLNARWNAAPPPGSDSRLSALPLVRLEEIYRGCSYLSRWSAQIQERHLQLAF